ncbi:hypothetical protein CCL24_25720 [Pseudomonas congelans]|jgi:hypothetical protein|nr:hypothetical protein CCL24_25720 [Pseudomonas congelans]
MTNQPGGNRARLAVIVLQHLAPVLIAIAAAPVVGYLFRSLRSLHLKFRDKPLSTDEEYAALAKVGRLLCLDSWLGKAFF